MNPNEEHSTEYERHEQWRASWRAFVSSPFEHWRELTGIALLFICLAVFATAAGAEKATIQAFSGFALVITASFLAFHDQRKRVQALQKRIDTLQQQTKTSGKSGPRLDFQKGHLHVHGNSVTISLEYKNLGDDASEVACWNVKIWWAELGDHPHYAESIGPGDLRPNSSGEVLFELGMKVPAEAPVYVLIMGMWYGAETKTINHSIDYLKWVKSTVPGSERKLSIMADGERHSVSKYVSKKMKVSRHPKLEAIFEKAPETLLSQEALREIMKTMLELKTCVVPSGLRSTPLPTSS